MSTIWHDEAVALTALLHSNLAKAYKAGTLAWDPDDPYTDDPINWDVIAMAFEKKLNGGWKPKQGYLTKTDLDRDATMRAILRKTWNLYLGQRGLEGTSESLYA